MIAMSPVDVIDTAIPVVQFLHERGVAVTHLIGLDDQRSPLSTKQANNQGFCKFLDTTQPASTLI